MDETRWTSFDLIFFDCDSTLSAIEGIDELARFKGKEWRVGVLTEKDTPDKTARRAFKKLTC